MDKAVLKTLIYADIFNYPLTIREIHRWLIGKKCELRQLERALNKLKQELRISSQGSYYFLSGRQSLVAARVRKKRQSSWYFKKVRAVAFLLKIIPWIKLVGISGGLSMENAGKGDDIDLFIITSKDRLWISRLLILLLVELTGQRRKVSQTSKKAAGKVCINILLEEDKLAQQKKDLYLAHEVLQMRVLWQRDGVYSRYLLDNGWAFEYLPNWVDSGSGTSIKNYVLREEQKNPRYLIHNTDPINVIEVLAKKFQLWYMKPVKGQERIQDGALYFHPNDYRERIISEYRDKLRLAGLN